MNKLTEIKQLFTDYQSEDIQTRLKAMREIQTRYYEDIPHLLSLIEEKDKALASAEWSIEHMLREQPNEMWTEQECESWDSFGKDSLKEIKAVVTSSNNEREV